MTKTRWSAAAAAVVFSLSVAAQAAVPTPKEVLGHEVGEDYYLATYEDAVAYFHKLAAASPRIKMFTAGKTTQGRILEYAVISTPENLAKYDHYKEVSKKLAAVKGLDDAAAKALAKEGKVIIHLDGGMHASEVAGPQTTIAMAYTMVATEGDEEIDAIRDNVILVLWPTINPDGMDMIIDWYRKNRGTPFETSGMPYLYQEYVGHDNNRDGYMLNMIESQNVFKAEQEYDPSIWYSYHQTAPFPARIWVPPFAEPISSNISPYVRSWTTQLGINMMSTFEAKQMPGAIALSQYDNWYPGFLDYTHVFRNTISFFTEVAHASATPRNYDLKSFPANRKDLKATVFYPHPWEGGMWHLSDSIRYNHVAAMSVMDMARRYKTDLLYNRYQAGRDTIKRFTTKGPFAWVIPSGQADAPEAALMAQKLIEQGLTVTQTTGAVTIGGQSYPAGTWVVPMDQPFAALVQELFEAQKYPDAVIGDSSGKPVDLPYDATGWTIPMQFGIKAVAVGEKLSPEALAALKPVAKAETIGGVTGDGTRFALSRKTNASYLAANEAAAKGATLALSTGPVATVNGPETGAIIVSGISRAAMNTIAAARGVQATTVAGNVAAEGFKPGRVGLYRAWGGNNIDEGWTRWLLEQYKFNPVTLRDPDLQKGGLRARFDTIVIPDVRNRDALINGLRPEQVPAPYVGGIGDEGAIALKKFVADGGTLVTLNGAADAVIDIFALPVRNVVKNARSEEFFCSGALLEVKLGQASRSTAGMEGNPIVMFQSGPVFQPTAGFKGNVLASFAPEDNPLRSGVLLHPEAIRGRAAALEVEYGKGRVFLYGFRPQWRGQSHGTYKMLFNTLYAFEQPEPSATTLSAN